MKRIELVLHNRAYSIQIEYGLLFRLKEILAEIVPGDRRFLLVTDEVVAGLYGKRVLESLAGLLVDLFILPSGEENKNLENLNRLYDYLILNGYERRDVLLAFGGGVVGDITGMAAATYLRGVPYIQIPSTLLAQVDAGIGGKVAVNHALGKNLIGSFYQPKAVLVDPSLLDTLSERELRGAIAEVIKYGVALDYEFFVFLEENVAGILEGDRFLREEMVARACELKAGIVRQDELDLGVRTVLNFGHTLGHALEQLGEYREYSHGEAVSIGMVAVFAMAEELGLVERGDKERVIALLEQVGLPVRVKGMYAKERIKESIGKDKKKSEGQVRWVLPERIGKAKINCIVPEKILDRVLLDLMG